MQKKIEESIFTPEQALAYLRQHRKHSEEILSHERINQLLNDQSDKEKSVYYSKHRRKRPSFSTEINWDSKEVSIFKADRKIGQGAFGVVRVFIDQETQEHRAVKLEEEAGEEGFIRTIQASITDEARFIKEVYDQEGACEAFFFLNHPRSPTYISARIVMPMIAGIRLTAFLNESTTPLVFAQVMKQVASAVLRLHDKNIIHGDLSSDNIHILTSPCLHAKLLDFGYSYRLSDQYAKTTEEKCSWAPERIIFPDEPKPKPKPNTNHDVYALGSLLLIHVTALRREHQVTLLNQYPSIAIFLQSALESSPERRPSLHDFLCALTAEQHHLTHLKETAHLFRVYLRCISTIESDRITLSLFKLFNNDTRLKLTKSLLMHCHHKDEKMLINFGHYAPVFSILPDLVTAHNQSGLLNLTEHYTQPIANLILKAFTSAPHTVRAFLSNTQSISDISTFITTAKQKGLLIDSTHFFTPLMIRELTKYIQSRSTRHHLAIDSFFRIMQQYVENQLGEFNDLAQAILQEMTYLYRQIIFSQNTSLIMEKYIALFYAIQSIELTEEALCLALTDTDSPLLKSITRFIPKPQSHRPADEAHLNHLWKTVEETENYLSCGFKSSH